MANRDPKLVAQERFAQRDWGDQALGLVERCSTDAPLVVAGLIQAVRERARPGSRVIELGFGGGWLLQELSAAFPDAELYGLDLSPGFARRAYKEHGRAVRILLGDMDHLPFRDGVFDVVITCWTLYFMRDIDATLVEIKRCMATDARFIAATNAPDHEAECGELVSDAIRTALGRDEPEHDVASRFDLESGPAYVQRQFPEVRTERWNGELVISDPRDIEALWPKWEPALMPGEEQLAVREQFVRLARERIERDGALHIRRRNCAFVCDVQGEGRGSNLEPRTSS